MSRAAIDSASAQVFRYRDRLPESVRLSVVASYYRTGQGRDRAKATDAYQRMFDHDSTATHAIFVAAMANNRRQFARAESLLVFATAKDSNQNFAYGNLAIALINQGELDRAGVVIATLRKRFPSYQTSGIRAAEVAYQGGDLARYRRVLDSMRLTPAPRIKSYGLTHLALLELLGGRLRESERQRVQAEAIDSAVGSPTPPIVDSVRRSFQDAWYRGEGPRAVRRLDDALRSSTLKAIAAADRPDYEIATAYALAGRPDRARAVLRAYVGETDTSIVRDRKPEEHEALAYILLAERKPLRAVEEFRMADRRPDGPRDANPIRVLAQLGFAFDAANQPDSSIAMFERYKTTPYNGHGDADGDSRYLAAVEKRLGELYEAKGDRGRAADAFTAFIGLWKNADPELQPRVAEARARLQRLRPESSRP
jgi:tetratricopeptide (TPR) repeat protein